VKIITLFDAAKVNGFEFSVGVYHAISIGVSLTVEAIV
jgi:hypothetical protein